MTTPGTLKLQESRQPSKAWFVRSFGDGFLDARSNNLSDRARWVFLILDCRAAKDAFCYPGNEWVREKTGKKDSTLREIYGELEDAGWLRRIYTDETKTERIGFVFLRRVDHETPVAENTPRGIELATRSMLGAMSEGGQA